MVFLSLKTDTELNSLWTITDILFPKFKKFHLKDNVCSIIIHVVNYNG